MNKGITAENLTLTFPEVMQSDVKAESLAKAVADALSKEITELDKIRIYPQLDELPEELLDILANDLKVDWYDYDYDVETKRQILRQSGQVHRRLGTPWAIEVVLLAYFKEGEIEEWFDYGGEPHHFRIRTGNLTLSDALYERFWKILQAVKRKSQWLDSITEHTEVKLEAKHGVADGEIYAQYFVETISPN
ncbi:MAG: phage tail protein I [Oscillospiraceae bacterium]|nr:phage tail protein I [Oscillospiraceae bacterium]